jgi:mercuric ion transport protein
MTRPRFDTTYSRRSSGWGAVSLTLGGLGAAFAVAACCALPILLGSLGIGTAWLFGVAKLAAPHRTVLLAIAAISLAAGALALWRQTRAACPADGWCARPAVRRLTMLGVAFGLVLLVLGYRYA